MLCTIRKDQFDIQMLATYREGYDSWKACISGLGTRDYSFSGTVQDLTKETAAKSCINKSLNIYCT